VSAKGITHADLGTFVVVALFLHKIPEGMAFGSFLGFKENSTAKLTFYLTVNKLFIIV